MPAQYCLEGAVAPQGVRSMYRYPLMPQEVPQLQTRHGRARKGSVVSWKEGGGVFVLAAPVPRALKGSGPVLPNPHPTPAPQTSSSRRACS